MASPLWITLLVIAIGTLLLRVVPLWWMSRRINQSDKENLTDNLPIWLSVLGPAMIAAMFGTSLVPSSPTIITWSATFLGALVTYAFWYWKRTLGLPVFAGVISYGLTIYLAG